MTTTALPFVLPSARRWLSVLTRVALALLLAAQIPDASAAPDDDHRRGLGAYHRGDVVAAMRALRPAAEAGHAPAQALLGFILEKSGDYEQAARLYARAAAQDDVEGHASLGHLLLAGQGIAKDEKRALVHFSKAAERGHAPSIMLLAEAYRRGSHGLSPAAPEATLWQQRAAALKGTP